MFSSLLSLLWSFIPKRYLTNHQVLFFTFRHLWKTENKWNELKNGNNYCCNTSSELPLQFIQQVESCDVTSKKLVGLLQRPLAKKNVFCIVYCNIDHIRVDFICLYTCNQLQHASTSLEHTRFILHGAPQCKFTLSAAGMQHSAGQFVAWLMDTGPGAVFLSESIPVWNL